MSNSERPRRTQKTYSHLLGKKRVPSEYDLLSSELLYYFERGGFEIDLPIGGWYAEHQRASKLCTDGALAFRDPRETTYTSYTALQAQKESYCDELLEATQRDGYDERLAESWVLLLTRAFFPARYPCHGLQMAAAYVGQMAPSGQIAIAAAFQTGDEIRRVQRIAQRMALLQRTRPETRGLGGREVWQDAPLLQPLRGAIERLLVTYDWGEALVATNLCVKPAFDFLFRQLGRAGYHAGDYLFAELIGSLDRDATWHRSWSIALLEGLDGPAREAAVAFARAWRPTATEAIAPLLALVDCPASRLERHLSDLAAGRANDGDGA